MARRKWTYETINQVLNDENPFIQIGYNKPEERRKEGEIWTDARGNTWKQLNGAKVSVNKQMDDIRSMLKRICSVCGQNIDFSNDKLDHKVFPKTGKCYTCLEAEETNLRVTGKYKQYEDLKLIKNKLGLLKDFKAKVTEAIDFLKNDHGVMELTLETGEQMKWTGKSNPQWLKDAEDDLAKTNEEIKRTEEELFKLESNEQQK